MRHTLACCLALMSVTACQGLPVTASKRLPFAQAVSTLATLATTAPSATPTAQPSAPPTLGPSPSPQAATIALRGEVSIDASYVLALGRGQVIGNNGSGVVKLSGSTMLDDADIGILSHNGASILSHNGGSLISDKGGTIISQNGAGYALLDVPSVGEVLPAEGMGVRALSLTTGKALGPAVATDSHGDYTLTIPASERDNVLVVAQVPGASAADPILADPRLLYSVTASPGGASQVLDEDSALVTRYLRQSYSAVLLQFLQSKPGAPLVFTVPLPAGTQAIAQSLADQLRQEAAGVPAASYPALADRLADVALSQVDLAHAHIDATGTPWKGPDELAVPAMVAIMRAVRTAASAKMSADPHYFDSAPYVLKINAARPAEAAYHIVRPSDLGDFTIAVSLSGVASQGVTFVDILEDLGLDTSANDHLEATEVGLSEQLALTLVKPQVNALLLSTIRAFATGD